MKSSYGCQRVYLYAEGELFRSLIPTSSHGTDSVEAAHSTPCGPLWLTFIQPGKRREQFLAAHIAYWTSTTLPLRSFQSADVLICGVGIDPVSVPASNSKTGQLAQVVAVHVVCPV